jgi:hypothetical protein
MSTKTVSFTLPATETNSIHCGGYKSDFANIPYKTSGTRQIIPVNGANGNLNNLGSRKNPINIDGEKTQKLSPEAEMYGFGEKFRENRKNYFNQSSNISVNNNNSLSRCQSQHSTFISTSYPNDKNPTIHRDVASFSTPEVILQNQSFLDSLSAKLSIGGNIKSQSPSNTQTQVSVNHTKSKWPPTQSSVNQISNSIPSMQRSPSFGSVKLDNVTTKNNVATNMNTELNTIPNSTNKNKVHTEIERGAFNLRKTNGIIHDRSAPKL